MSKKKNGPRWKRTLDKKHTRHDRLTSRECAGLLGGAIEGYLVIFPEKIVREVLRYIADTESSWKVYTAVFKMKADKLPKLSQQATADVLAWGETIEGDLEQYSAAMLVIRPFIGALCNNSTIKNARIGVRWWSDRDEAWELFRRQTDEPFTRDELEANAAELRGEEDPNEAA